MPPGAWFATLWLLVCLARDSSQALTTFGKTNPQNAVPAKPTAPPGRECTKEVDCAGIQDTSCVKNQNDGKMRCLCGDNTSPLNGRCESKMKGLRHGCSQSVDCMDGMICALPNATKTGAAKPPATFKMCLCNVEDGFVDREFYCSDGFIHKSVYFMIFLTALATSWMSNAY